MVNNRAIQSAPSSLRRRRAERRTRRSARKRRSAGERVTLFTRKKRAVSQTLEAAIPIAREVEDRENFAYVKCIEFHVYVHIYSSS